MKKVILAVLAVAMILSLCMIGTFAADDDPALLITASQLGAAGNQYVNDVQHELLEEDGVSFARFTATKGDPWVWIQPAPTTDTANKYAAIKYRTTVGGPASIYAEIAEPHVDFTLNNDGAWHVQVVDLSNGGANTNWKGALNRLDPHNGESGSIDYAWIALFADEAKAAAYTGPKVEMVRVNSYDANGGVGIWVGTAGGRNKDVGVIFNATSSFNSFGIPTYWANGGAGVVGVYLYKFDTDFATSIAGTALYENLFATNGDGTATEFDLGQTFAPGEYVIAFRAVEGTDYFVLPNNVSKYSNVYLQFTPSAFGFYINFVKSDDGKYFGRLSMMNGVIETNAGTLCPRGNTPVDLKSGDFAVRVTVPKGYVLSSVTGIGSPTWTNTNGDSDAAAKIYAWDTDYATTVNGDVLATATIINHQDNADAKFAFDNHVNGDLLIVFSATNEGKFGFWSGEDKGVATEAFRNGESSNLYPGTNYELEVTGETMISLDRLYINYDALSFDETSYADEDRVVIKAGDKLNILGWAANSIGNVEKVYWTLDGEVKECSDTYRSRGDLATHTGYDAKYLAKSGYGLDNDLMELLGVDELKAQSTHQVQIIVQFEHGYSQVIKEFTLVVAGKAKANLDGLAVNEDAWPLSANHAGDDSITITEGDKLNILGWAAKYGANLDKIYWQYIEGGDHAFDEEGVTIVTKECSDTYRDRKEAADGIGVAAEYLEKSGFGLDADMMELLGADELQPGTYTVRIRALFEDGTEVAVKKRFNLVVSENTAPAAEVIGKNFDEAIFNIIQIKVRGWARLNSEIDAFGYKIDDAEIVYNDAYQVDRSDVWNAFGVTKEVANGFLVELNPADYAAGKHTFTLYVKAKDGTVLELGSFGFERPHEETYENIVNFTDVASYGMSFDELFWNAGPLGGAGRTNIDLFANPDAMHANYYGGLATGFRGWVCFKQKVKGFGYLVNDKLYVSDSFVENNEPTLATTLESWGGDWVGSGEFVQRYNIQVPFAGMNGVCDIMGAAILEDGTVVRLNSTEPANRNTEIIIVFDDAEIYYDAHDGVVTTGWWTNPFNKDATAEISFTADDWFNGFELYVFASDQPQPVHATLKDAEGNVVYEKDFTLVNNWLYTFYEKDAKFAPGEYTLVFDGSKMEDGAGTWFVLASANAAEGKTIAATGNTNENTLAAPFFRLIKTAAAEPQPAAELTAEINDAGKLVVTATGSFGDKDWIGVYAEGTTPGGDGASIVWWYVGANGGTFEVPFEGMIENDKAALLNDDGTVKEGKYVVYLLANDGYGLVEGTEGVTVTVEAQPVTEPVTEPETQPQTGDAAVAMFAVIAVLAMGAAVVFVKKRAF